MNPFYIRIPEMQPSPFSDCNTSLERSAVEMNIALWAIAERLGAIALALTNKEGINE